MGDASSITQQVRVAFITMGCAKNEVDTRDMGKKLAHAGYVIVDDPVTADIAIVNTCSFIQTATEESIDAILDATELPAVASGSAKLIVVGCMVSRYGDELRKEFPEVADFITCADEADIVDRLGEVCVSVSEARVSDTNEGVAVKDIPEYAYVKISDGCDRFCSYCAIPYIRGRYHSFSYESIYEEVRTLVSQGCREIVLIAQDTGRWGQDLSGDYSLSWLLATLADTFTDTWFRVMYLQPEGVTDELLDVIARYDNIASYLDIPFQHCENTLLVAMNREGDTKSFMALIDRVRAKVTDCTLRTTLIVGFPGETDEQFEALCDFVQEIEFDYVGIFPYSQEDGTRAATFADQVSEEEKSLRLQRIRDISDTVSAAVISRRIGEVMSIIPCGVEEDGQPYGRTFSQAPEVDGVTYYHGEISGNAATVTITDTMLYEMEGDILS